MAYSVKTVANCFLEYSFNKDTPIIPLKLQKLVYCLHGWHLAITDEPAIDEYFEAWPYGPVNENLYHIFKSFGNEPITVFADTWDSKSKKRVAYVVSTTNFEFYNIFDMVVEKYMGFTAAQLSSITHAEGTPWDSIIRKEASATKRRIENDLIKQHFRSLVQKNQMPQREEAKMIP